MKCREFSSSYSALIDGHVSESEQADVTAHLSFCIECRRIARELRANTIDVAGVGRPSVPEGSSASIMAALRRDASINAQKRRRREDLIDVWRVRLFSQSIGAVISVGLLLVMTASVFRPAYRALAIARAAAETFVEDDNVADELRLKMLLLEPSPPPPVFNPSGALLGFSESLSENDILIATVKVRRDGRASVEAATETPRDPSVLGRLSNALFQQSNFQPVRRQNKQPDAVLMFSKVNIIG